MKGMNVVSLVSPSEDLVMDSPDGDVSLGVKITTFPDGQRDLRIVNLPVHDTARIDARLRNFSDLDLLIMAKRSLDDLGVKEVDLKCPYLPGARSDRRFGKGGTRYLAEVVAPIINALGFRVVVVWDPHSDVAENVVAKMAKVPFHEVFAGRLSRFDHPMLASPDAGATKKVYDVASATGITSVLLCSKHRDVATGKITGTHVPGTDHSGDIVVCDDIVDGGRTFTELAKAARASAPSARLHLVVTHGIFSSAPLFDELTRAYSSITTTNSFRDLTEVERTVARDNGCELEVVDCFPSVIPQHA